MYGEGSLVRLEVKGSTGAPRKTPTKQWRPPEEDQQSFTHSWDNCESVGLPAFSTLPIGVLKRGPTATDPCGALFQDSDSLKEEGEADELWSGVCTWGIPGKLVEAVRMGLDWAWGCRKPE